MSKVFKIHLSEIAVKQLQKLNKEAQKQIISFLDDLLVKINEHKIDPFILGKPLMGNLRGLYRFRTGDYRLITSIEKNKLLIYVLKIGHRKDVY